MCPLKAFWGPKILSLYLKTKSGVSLPNGDEDPLALTSTQEEQVAASQLVAEGFFDEAFIEEDEVAEDTSIIEAEFSQPMDM